MAKEDVLTLEGTITECLPGGLFRVKLENDHEIIGHLAGKIRQFRIKVILGDRVDVEVTPYDLAKGRIVYRHK